MAGPSDHEEAGEQQTRDSFGVLVGWTHREFNGRLDLKLETIQSTRHEAPDEVISHHVMLTRSQAAVLANYLFRISEQSPPKVRRKGLLGRLLRG